MKKGLCFILTLVLCLSLCSCTGREATTSSQSETTEQGNESIVSTPDDEENISSSTSETIEQEEESSIPKLSIGETASTDLVDFTLINAEFTIYASSQHSDYNLTPTDEKTLWGASIGQTLMIPTFTMTNKDRAGSIHVFDSEWPFDWTITYDNCEYTVYGFDLNQNNVHIRATPGCTIDPLTEFFEKENIGASELLYSGTSVSMRLVTIVNFEPKSLTDGFELTVSLPNTEGEMEMFTYAIPGANDSMSQAQQSYLYDKVKQLIELKEYYAALKKLDKLGDYLDSAELYDFCIRRYASQVGMRNIAEEYLTENMDSFAKVSGSDLNTIIPGNQWYVNGVGGNGWSFLEDGTIDDGWGNDRGWSIEGDLLVIRTEERYVKVTVLELYDGGYVLLKDGEFYATFYKV